MKRIVKLTESDLNRIVKRVIVETQESKKKEEIISKATNCFDPKNYPRIQALIKTGAYVFADVVLVILSMYAPGFFVPALALVGYATQVELERAFGKNDFELKKEAFKLLKCMGAI